MTNWVICIDVRYFFHCWSARLSGREAESKTCPDLGTAGGRVVVVVCTLGGCSRDATSERTHDDVDGQVEGDHDPLLACQLGPRARGEALTTDV